MLDWGLRGGAVCALSRGRVPRGGVGFGRKKRYVERNVIVRSVVVGLAGHVA